MNFNELPLRVPNIKECEKFYKEAYEKIKLANNAKEVASLMKKMYKFESDLETDVTVISIRYSIDTANKDYLDAKNATDEIIPVISSYKMPIIKEILSKPFRKELENIFGEYLFQKYEGAVKSFDEKIIPDLIEESKLTTQYDAILGGAKIKYKGQIYNLSGLRKFSQSLDREERKKVAKLSSDFFLKNNEALGEIYDKLVHLRDNMAHKLGFKNYIELGYLNLGRVDYDATMVAEYREQIRKNVCPIYKKLIKKQAARIGIKNPMFYDLNLSFLTGNPMPNGDAAKLVSEAQQMYNEMSKETGEFFTFMKESNLLDLETRLGKAPGGYMTYLPTYKAPFIFSNFNGTSDDLNVLTHEVGHAFQGYMSKDIKIPEYHMPGYEACEIHSMSMEFLAWPWMNLFFGKDAEKYKFMHLTDAIEFLPYGATVDEFQHYVYENVDATHAERCAKWREIEKKYLPLKKYNGFKFLNSGTWWLRQGHIFSSPFYYIDYTLAQVVAFEFLDESLEDKEKTWNKYVKLCSMGGKYPFRTLLKKAHLRDPFKKGTMKKNIKPLLKVLDNFDDAKM
ncbi:MAG: M3 family oligoendopeptidase [Bacilli bacterium]